MGTLGLDPGAEEFAPEADAFAAWGVQAALGADVVFAWAGG